MSFLITLIVISIIILFIIVFDAKKEIRFLKSIIQKHINQNDMLKKEIEWLRDYIQEKTIIKETIVPPAQETETVTETEEIELLEKTKPVEEIKPSEIKPEEFIVQDSNPYFVPIPEADLSNHEVIGAVETGSPLIPEEETVLAYSNEPNSQINEPTLEKPKSQKVYEESAFSVFMKKIEKQFADNWTGILGTAIMVLGIGYLSIYTALKVAPFYRILILWAYSGLLIGSYYLLKKKEKWEKTGLWLRSAGASLFLFGCFGASLIPALKFITNDAIGYSLLGVGIGLNLYIGYIIRQQTFLSLHVVLSMLVLCVIPDKVLTTFLLAAATGAIGIILSYKEKWEYHLLVVITAFIIFDIWFNAQGSSLTPVENMFAIAGIIAIATCCMFMQYRAVYENTRFDKPAFITHLTNWILFATGLVLHSTGSRFKTFVLLIGAIICFFMALKARKKKVYWLYHLDGMVAFVLCSLSIVMLNDWDIGINIIGCILYLLVIGCLFMVYREKEVLLHKIFLYINHVMVFILAIIFIILSSNSLGLSITGLLFSNVSLALTALAVPVFSGIKQEYLKVDSAFGTENLSLNGLFSIAAFVFLFLNCNNFLIENYFYYVMLGTALLWCYLKSKFEANTFDLGRIIFLVLGIVIGVILIQNQPKHYNDLILMLGILLVIVYNWFEKQFYRDELVIRFIVIIGTNALLMPLVYKYLPEHQIILLSTLLMIALLNHEFLWICFKRENLKLENQITLFIAYYFFAIAACSVLLKNISLLSNTKIGIECLAISLVAFYGLLAKRLKKGDEKIIPGWSNFYLFNSELLIFSVLVFGFSCLKIDFNAIYLAGIAVITLLAFQKLPEFNRFNLYSFGLLLLCIGLTLFSAMDNIDLENKTIRYISQIVCIVISALYVYIQSLQDNEKYNGLHNSLPYVQNFWIIALLFIQVQVNYLPLAFMLLAIVNYGLIVKGKIKISFHFTPLVGLLAILVSSFYSITKLNHFDTLDWILQLGSVALGLGLVLLLNKKEPFESLKSKYQIILNIWLSVIMFSQLPHKWLPVYWTMVAIVNLFLYHKKISREKYINIVYYFLANLHLGFLSFTFYESKFLPIYLGIFALLAIYIYLAYKWIEEYPIKNSLLIYPATLSIGCFLYLTFDKGILTFFWILEALGLLILGILLKEKYFRYVSLSLVGLCIIRLMFFDLSNTDFLIRALVLLGVGIVLIVMNSLFKKYKDRFD